ncbi:MAG: hypothetical protein AAGF12_04445 [Myxococcota bacterium]
MGTFALRISALAEVAGLVGLCGCGTDLGPCDSAAATAVVFDDMGIPYYAGQAQMRASCGNGAFCHSVGATGANRLGAPAELDFDMTVATTVVDDPAVDETARLRNGVERVRDWAGPIYRFVEGDTMPPFGESTITAHAGVSRYRFENGERMPQPDTIEGLEILRNWLSCGAPVVERTTPRPAGSEPVGDVVEARVTMPLEPTFPSLYQNVLFPLCGQSCHNPILPMQFDRSNLDLSTEDIAYQALVGEAPQGDTCGAQGGVLVDPNMPPDSSLFIQKFQTDTTTCGEEMPPGVGTPENVVEVFRQWIAAGALRN